MKKKILISLLLLMISIMSLNSDYVAQSTFVNEQYFSVDWEMTYGTNYIDFVEAITQTNDGNFVAAGRTEVNGSGLNDAYIFKIDPMGNMIWNITYGGPFDDRLHNIVNTSDGGVLMIGQTDSFGSARDLWVLKVDTNGHILWNKTYGGSQNDVGYSLVASGDDGFLLAGWERSSRHNVTVDGHPWLIKVDQTGNEIWNKTYAFSDAYMFDVARTSDNGFVFVGGAQKTSTSLNDYLILRVDENGNLIWNTSFGGLNNDRIEEVIVTPDGGSLVAGHTFSFGGGQEDSWLVKIDENGHQEWNKTFGGNLDESSNAILNDKDGGYFVCINSRSYGPGGENTWIIKIDENGNSIWNQTTGHANENDFAFDMIDIGENQFLLAGKSDKGGSSSWDAYVFQITLKNSLSNDITSTSGPNSSPGFEILSFIPLIMVVLKRKQRF